MGTQNEELENVYIIGCVDLMAISTTIMSFDRHVIEDVVGSSLAYCRNFKCELAS